MSIDAERLQKTFLELVGIDSPSRSEAQVAAYCEANLKELGFSVRFDDSALVTGSDTGNLIAYLPGTTAGHIMLSAHMDCVDPCEGVEPSVEDGIIRSVGETVLGADDKAGIAAILEALRSTVSEGLSRPSITVLLTTCEESSLLGALGLSEEVFSDSAPCFVFDADGEPGTIIVGSPYHYTLQARFSGKASHAGVEPEAGTSAIQMAARAIELMELGRISEDTTANVGMIEGGREVNIVPDICLIRGECRSLYKNRIEDRRTQMTKACEAAAAHFGGKVLVDWHLDYPGVLYDIDDPLVQTLVVAAERADLTPCFAISGGGADTNILNAKGARAITLGIGMTSFHSMEEFITVEDLEGTARFAEAIIMVHVQK